MEVFSWDEVQGGGFCFQKRFPHCAERAANGSALTIGGFDGTHLGHQAVFSAVRAASGLCRGVVTFTNSPRAAKEGAHFAGSISTAAQKLEFLEGFGFDFALLIDFSSHFGRMKGEDFLDVLHSACIMRFLAVGSDFKCGYKLDTGAAELSAYAQKKRIDLRLVPPVCVAGERVSSSAIRRAVAAADFALAERLLGCAFSVDCTEFVQKIEGENVVQLKPQSGFLQIMPPVGRYKACIEAAVRDSGREPDFRSFSGIVEVNPAFLRCRFSFNDVRLKVQAVKFESL